MKRIFENTETKTVVTNIFNKEDEKMVEHLLRKMLGLGVDLDTWYFDGGVTTENGTELS